MPSSCLTSFFVLLTMLLSCNTSVQENPTTEFNYQHGQLNIISNVVLGEDEVFDPSSAAISFKKCGDFYGFMSRGSVIRIYDATGQRQFLFDKKALDNHYLFPNGLPVAFDYDAQANLLYVLFGGSKTLFAVNTQGQITKSIALELPKILSAAMAPHLEVSFEEKAIYLTTGDRNADVIDHSFFKNSPLISRFTMKGEFINNIGAYPKAYHQSGKFSNGHPFRFYRYLREKDRHYFLFDISAEVHEYNSQGELLTVHAVPSNIRNYRFEPSGISYFSDQRIAQPTNDIHYFMAKRHDKALFYIGHQLLREEHGKKDTYLLRADPKAQVITEINLTETFGIAFHARLGSIMPSDTLDFFLASPFSDQVRVVKAIIE